MINLSRNFRLALRLARRDWRGGELGILLAALVIAVAGTAATYLFSDRLARTMTEHAAEFIAGDLTLAGHRPMDAAWLAKSHEFGVRHAASVEFSSILMENEQILLTGVKAVSGSYPLRGELRTTTGELSGEQATREAPPRGTVWVESRVLAALGLALGASVTVGSEQFRITRLLTHEPDRRGDLYSLSPRVLMNIDDLEATRIVQPGSRVHYYDMFAGDDTAVRRFKTWLKPRLKHGDRLLDVHEDRPEVGTALSRAERYLGLTGVMVVVIAGVAIGMSARRYTERHYDTTALLKCLGAGQADILTIYALILLIVGLPAVVLGSALGYATQTGLAWSVARLLPHSLAQPGLDGLLLAPLTGLVILAGFALPPLPGLMRIPPLRVLRRDLAPDPASAWMIYGFAFGVLWFLLSRYMHDQAMVAAVLGGGGLILVAFRILVDGLLRLAPKLARGRTLAWRLGFHNLVRRPRLASIQILGFGLVLVAMLVSFIVRNELIDEWKRQLPENAPNYFALNLQENDLDRFRQVLAANSISASELYPIVRGRLTRVDGVDVRLLAAKDSQAEAAIDRDLSLTWSDALPAGNRITAGGWWSGGTYRISVEEKLAGQLGIRPGSRLTFDMAGTAVEAVVESLRSVRWDSMTPNFYVIFSPGSLLDQPRTYLTSFYLPGERNSVLNRLVKAFPAITLLDVDALLKQFQSILSQVTLAIEFVLGFALFAGFTVLFAAVHATADERLREDALLRAMGAGKSLLRKSQWIEFATLGAIAGFLAVAGAETLGAVVFTQVMNLEPHIHRPLWIAAPLIGAFSVALAGNWSASRVLKRSPGDVLRDLSL